MKSEDIAGALRKCAGFYSKAFDARDDNISRYWLKRANQKLRKILDESEKDEDEDIRGILSFYLSYLGL